MTRRVAILACLMLLLVSGCLRDNASKEEKDRAVSAAIQVYDQQRAAGVDFTNGPCIAEEVIDDWSADIAHDPRQDIDNQPENQCQAYRDGTTHHFVELDPEGKLIRAK